jgi:hypothetical protein
MPPDGVSIAGAGAAIEYPIGWPGTPGSGAPTGCGTSAVRFAGVGDPFVTTRTASMIDAPMHTSPMRSATDDMVRPRSW